MIDHEKQKHSVHTCRRCRIVSTMYEKSETIDKPKSCINWKVLKSASLDFLMLPCLAMCFFLGFFPYECNPPRYTFSKIRFAFFILVTIVYMIFLTLLIYEINFTDVFAKHITDVIHRNMYAFLDGIVVLVIYFQIGARMRVMKRLRDVSSILSTKDFNDMSRFVHAKDICGFLYLFVHIPNCMKPHISQTVRNFVCLYIMLVNFSADMFYVNCVYTLKWCFKNMNEGLQDLRKATTDEYDTDDNTQVYHDYGQVNGLVLVKLKHFEEKHSRISDVVELVNDTFFVQIIFVAISTFIIITFNLYFYILYSNSGEPFNDKFWYKPHITPACFYFVKFTLMCWACQTATNEAQKMKFTLCEVFGGTSDLPTKRRVDLFFLQLLHRDNVFTAKAIDMDLSLLAKIVSGIMMYIIILFQFLLNYILCGP